MVGFVLEFDLEFGLESDPVLGQGPGWEFDQESLQVFDRDMDLGRCLVCRGPLGHDQVSELRRSHQVSGSTVSGTLLK